MPDGASGTDSVKPYPALLSLEGDYDGQSVAVVLAWKIVEN
jgi:hypothetical protein